MRIQRRGAGGFTLLEVMLVLALMVAVMAMASVNFRNSFRDQRLRSAAQQVRTQWAQARIEAIKSGRVHVFYHTLHGRRFLVTPQASLDDPTLSLGGTMSDNPMQPTGFSGAADGATATDRRRQDMSSAARVRELPRGVTFLAANVQIDQRSAIQMNGAADPSQFAQANAGIGFEQDPVRDEQWGVPIYFFPDGSSSTAQLAVMNDRLQTIQIYLRGLTGLVRVGEVERSDTAGLQEAPR